MLSICFLFNMTSPVTQQIPQDFHNHHYTQSHYVQIATGGAIMDMLFLWSSNHRLSACKADVYSNHAFNANCVEKDSDSWRNTGWKSHRFLVCIIYVWRQKIQRKKQMFTSYKFPSVADVHIKEWWTQMREKNAWVICAVTQFCSGTSLLSEVSVMLSHLFSVQLDRQTGDVENRTGAQTRLLWVTRDKSRQTDTWSSDQHVEEL